MIARLALVELRDRFPVWFGAWLAIGHVLTATLLMQPPQTTALATVLIPLAWVALFYAALPAARRPPAATLGAVVAAAPVMGLLCWLPAGLMFRDGGVASLRFAFEMLAPLWALALAVHCHRDRGWTGVAVFFGLGAAYGLILESSGIDLGYFSEAGYRIYIPFTHTPLSSIAGWCTIFYPCVYTAEVVARRLAPRSTLWVPAAVVTADALSTDLHFDPIATALGMWVWNPRLAPVWFGVPLVNFTSWFSAVSAIAVAYFWIARRARTPRGLLVIAPLGLVAALALSAALNLLVIGLLEGFSGPSWSILLEGMKALVSS